VAASEHLATAFFNFSKTNRQSIAQVELQEWFLNALILKIRRTAGNRVHLSNLGSIAGISQASLVFSCARTA